MTGAQTDFRYIRLADDLEGKIREGTYRAGEKLPSIRRLHGRTGLSISTVYQAYIELERRGCVTPRQKSGFYVRPATHHLLPPPRVRPKPARPVPQKVNITNLVSTIVEMMSDPAIVQFGGAAPASDLLPNTALSRLIKGRSNREINQLLSRYAPPAGLSDLRREIAKRMTDGAYPARADEVIVTNGCMEAISICLRAVARPGDTILVESPTFHCFLELIEDQRMLALELPADPQSGIDLPSLERALAENPVRACLLNPNHQNPLGFVMPDGHKRDLVAMVTGKGIPIIEDDIYGDLYFGRRRPATLKSFDQREMVLYCASFSKTLSPGLRVGWTLPGRYREAVQRIKLNTSICSPAFNQQVVADFLSGGGHDRHLRRLRGALKQQVDNVALSLARHFPEGTRHTVPQGGLMLWVELPEQVDSLDLFYKAIARNIAIMPGAVASATDAYRHFIRISCGNPWGDAVQAGLALLGELASRMAVAPE